MAVRRFPVEASHIMMFARAINDANPIYHDEEHAKRTEVGRIIAPPTFAQASAQFDLLLSHRVFGRNQDLPQIAGQAPGDGEGGSGSASQGHEQDHHGGENQEPPKGALHGAGRLQFLTVDGHRSNLAPADLHPACQGRSIAGNAASWASAGEPSDDNRRSATPLTPDSPAE